jgi:hypothetical protein
MPSAGSGLPKSSGAYLSNLPIITLEIPAFKPPIH